MTTAMQDFLSFLQRAMDAGVPELSDTQLQLCVSDLCDLYDEDWTQGTVDTWQEWIRRLGGLGNIPAYARTLEAGRRRAAGWGRQDGSYDR